MNPNADDIWRVPAYLPYLQPHLSDDAIVSAEEIFGSPLPEELLALLRKQNGGYIRFSLPEMVHDSIAGIGPHYPSLLHFNWDEVQQYVSFPLQGLVPFDGDGHWHLCLDYRTAQAQPSITYVDVECDSQRPIAGSFSEYLSMLTLDVGDEFVVNSVDIPQLLSQLTNVIGAKFDPPDLWAHGYPTYRAALGGKGDPEWLWITPNRVVRGFVRKGEPRYSELKDMLPGYGRRFPELSDDSLIVSATAGVRQKVLDAFQKCNFQLQPMRELIESS